MGNKFREWRLYRDGLTQDLACERLMECGYKYIERTLLSKIERSESPYNEELLKAMSLAYDAAIEDLLFYGPGERPRRVTVGTPEATLLDMFAALPEAARAEFLKTSTLIAKGLELTPPVSDGLRTETPGTSESRRKRRAERMQK